MARDFLGNIKGPQGPKGDDGIDLRQLPYNAENMVKNNHNMSGYAGNFVNQNNIETFVSTGTNTTTYASYPYEYELSSDEVYEISFDYYSETVTECDDVWIINNDGSHSNYSIHSDNRNIFNNLFDIPLGKKVRCYVIFQPSIDLIGTLRIGSKRSESTGQIQISRVSLSKSHDVRYKKPTDKRYAGGRFYKSDLNDDFSIFGFEHSGGFDNTSGKVIMPTGRFLFVQNTYIRDGDPDTDLFLTLNINGVRNGYYRGNASHSGTLTAVLDTEQGDELELTTSYNAGGDFTPDSRNVFTITEL